MKKHIISTVFGLLLVFGAVTARPQGERAALNLMPRWETGEKHRYEMVKTRLKQEGDRVTLNATSITPISLEVLEAGQRGYLIRWVMGKTQVQNPEQTIDPLARTISRLIEDIQILLELDPKGKVLGVRNWVAVQEKVQQFVADVLDENGKSEIDSTTREAIQQKVLAMVATRERIERLCTRDPGMFFFPTGRSYLPGASVVYEDRIPNPLGGDPLPGRGVFHLQRIDSESGTALISWEQTIDPDAGRRVMEKTLKDLAQQLGRPVAEEGFLENLIVRDQALFTVQLLSGWPERINHSRITRIGDTYREDILSFEQQ